MAPTVRKFTIQAPDFLAAAKWAEKGTSKNDPMFSVSIANGELGIYAYNGIHASAAKAIVDQKFDDDTRFSVEARMLLDPLKNMGSNEIEVSFTGRIIEMKTRQIKVSIPVVVPRSAPTLPKMPPKMGTVETKEFTSLLAHATMMASDDPSAPSLTTVHFEVSPQDKSFKMMSTDRYRMVIRKVAYTPAPVEPDENGVIPDNAMDKFNFDVDSAALKGLVSALDDADTLTLFAGREGEANRLFGLGTNVAQASVVMKDVKPINYSQFEKMTAEKGVLFERRELVQTLNKTKALVQGSVKKASILIEGSDVSVIAKNDSGFETVMGIDHKGHDYDEDYRITTNLDYMITVLKAGTSKQVKVLSDTPSRAILAKEIKDDGTVDPSYFSLFMPIKSD